ncbi:nucleoside-diphosphate sugar epimerase/dehydratase [Lentzea nigeriaca]|uniref:nucleoside-diphosphate sugar epimerase/dehydratase n=1 Tax=Lentzea nigeriaca TaxID=1128665 RepID=UPI0019568567|nr:nucleoside-diphosphate sugar epimerase/dehydratase [Lentzea nigeriaca]MBM7859164.1 FlaA1/EpsC-like NDP-sugar epimerase [Lentzea nigeriaca]
MAAVTWFRYALEATHIEGMRFVRFTLIVLVIAAVVGLAARLYSGRYPAGSLEEAVRLAWVAVITGAFAVLVDVCWAAPPVPRSVPLTSAFVALFLSWSGRGMLRWSHERWASPERASARRVVILGAGVTGEQLVRSMLSDPTSGYLPVALLDDDPAKQTLRIRGVPVSGTRKDVVAVASRTGATLIVVALREPDPAVLREMSDTARQAGLGLQVLPSLDELLRSRVGVADLRELDLAALLGRQQVHTGADTAGEHLAGKRVLVTGAGGSVGAELCRQIHRFGPTQLFMLDRDESALHAVRLSIYGEAMLDSPDVVLADIRDAEAMRVVFARCQPDVVFHAAALKHLTALEQYPLEAWKTNVLGTYYVLEASRAAGVNTFVNISTDKAANPTSVLGSSKRVGERLTADAATRSDGKYLSVRFGNVFGSRGSVLSTFTEQLAQGRPITVTHPEVSRFFMTIPEAVQLVLQAVAIGRSGEALLLDMGEQLRIADVARQLMEVSGKCAPIVYTGLREGEKLHEELFGPGELDQRPSHPAISQVAVPPLDPAYLLSLAVDHGEIEAMTECATGVVPVPRPADTARSDASVTS